MKSIIILSALAATTISSSAAITLASGPTNNGGDYGTDYFTGVSVNVGDILVVAHSNNKRDNGNNSISMTGLGVNTINTLAGGDSGTQAAGWVFYSSITTAGTFNLTLDTNSTNKSVSESTTLYVIRGGVGETLSVSATDIGNAAAATSQTLTFNMSPAVVDAFGIVASGISNAAARVGTPAGWTGDNVGGAGNIRGNYSNADIDGVTESVTFNSDAAAGFSSAGIVVSIVPEPSAALLGAIGSLMLLRRRR